MSNLPICAVCSASYTTLIVESSPSYAGALCQTCFDDYRAVIRAAKVIVIVNPERTIEANDECAPSEMEEYEMEEYDRYAAADDIR